MRGIAAIAAAAAVFAAPAPANPTDAAVPAAPVATLTGIPLDPQWKAAIYDFARTKLLHPAWGWTHSERDYRLASEIAQSERLTVDHDVLFAAAFLHDMGAVGEFQKPGLDHAERSAELAEPLLRSSGFPMHKWPAVRDAILGHMHDKAPGTRPEAIVLHDADTLDFLGTVGIARRLAVTGSAPDYSAGLARIVEFAAALPGRLVTTTARRQSTVRVEAMRQFLDRLASETADGRLP